RRAHGLADLGRLVSDVHAHLVLVLAPVESHAQQRQAVGVAVGRVEIQIVAAIALARTLDGDGTRAGEVFRDGLLPLRSPARRPRRYRAHFDRPCRARATVDVAAADESQPRVVEVVAVEVVDTGRVPTRPHEAVED